MVSCIWCKWQGALDLLHEIHWLIAWNTLIELVACNLFNFSFINKDSYQYTFINNHYKSNVYVLLTKSQFSFWFGSILVSICDEFLLYLCLQEINMACAQLLKHNNIWEAKVQNNQISCSTSGHSSAQYLYLKSAFHFNLRILNFNLVLSQFTTNNVDRYKWIKGVKSQIIK